MMRYKQHWETDDTGWDRYVLDEWPGRYRRPLTDYRTVPDFSPSHDWAEVKGTYDDYFTRFPAVVLNMIERESSRPIGTSAQLVQLKDWVRQHQKQFDRVGVICYTAFTCRPPAWVIVDHQEAYRIVSDEEAAAAGLPPQGLFVARLRAYYAERHAHGNPVR